MRAASRHLDLAPARMARSELSGDRKHSPAPCRTGGRLRWRRSPLRTTIRTSTNRRHYRQRRGSIFGRVVARSGRSRLDSHSGRYCRCSATFRGSVFPNTTSPFEPNVHRPTPVTPAQNGRFRSAGTIIRKTRHFSQVYKSSTLTRVKRQHA